MAIKRSQLFNVKSSLYKILDKLKPPKMKMEGSLYEKIKKNKRTSTLISKHTTPTSQNWNKFWRNVSKLDLDEEDIEKICLADNRGDRSMVIKHLDWDYINKNVSLSQKFKEKWNDEIYSNSPYKEEDEEELKKKEREVLKEDIRDIQGKLEELTLADRLRQNDKEPEKDKTKKKKISYSEAEALTDEVGFQKTCSEFDLPVNFLLSNKDKIFLTEKVLETLWGGYSLRHFLITMFKIKLHLKDNTTLNKLKEDYNHLLEVLSYSEIDKDILNMNLDKAREACKDMDFEYYYENKMQKFNITPIIMEIINILNKAFILIKKHKLYSQGLKWEIFFINTFNKKLFIDVLNKKCHYVEKDFTQFCNNIIETNSSLLADNEFFEKEHKLKHLTEVYSGVGFKINHPKYRKVFMKEHLNFSLVLLSMCIPSDIKLDDMVRIILSNRMKLNEQLLREEEGLITFEEMKYSDIQNVRGMFASLDEERKVEFLKSCYLITGQLKEIGSIWKANSKSKNYKISDNINTIEKFVKFQKVFNLKESFNNFSFKNKPIWLSKIKNSIHFKKKYIVELPKTALELTVWCNNFNTHLDYEECTKMKNTRVFYIALKNYKTNNIEHIVKLDTKGQLVDIICSIRSDVKNTTDFFYSLKEKFLFTMKPQLDKNNVSKYY